MAKRLKPKIQYGWWHETALALERDRRFVPRDPPKVTQLFNSKKALYTVAPDKYFLISPGKQEIITYKPWLFIDGVPQWELSEDKND